MFQKNELRTKTADYHIHKDINYLEIQYAFL